MKTHEDEPQEQCVRCGKDFLTANAEIKDGICTSCVDEEEVKEDVIIRHKKFSNKILSLPVAAH